MVFNRQNIPVCSIQSKKFWELTQHWKTQNYYNQNPQKKEEEEGKKT